MQYNTDSPGIIIKTSELNGDITLVLPINDPVELKTQIINIQALKDPNVDAIFDDAMPENLSINENGYNMFPLDFSNYRQGNNVRYSMVIKDPAQQALGDA